MADWFPLLAAAINGGTNIAAAKIASNGAKNAAKQIAQAQEQARVTQERARAAAMKQAGVDLEKQRAEQAQQTAQIKQGLGNIKIGLKYYLTDLIPGVPWWGVLAAAALVLFLLFRGGR